MRSIETVEALLAQLRARLDEGLSWEIKRQFVEVLVDGIAVNTTTEDGKRQASVAVRYRFAESVKTCTGIRAGFNCYIGWLYVA